VPALSLAIEEDRVLPGEAYLSDTPALQAHAGTQPDLFLRWNAIPLAAEAVDIVVHLHGFSQQGGAMPLAEKVPRSGLDLTGRTRPTLALLPRGNWIRHYYYDFPALLDGGIDRLLGYALAQFAKVIGHDLSVDHLILSAHSGGVIPALDILAGAQHQPDELYLFDGLYGRDPNPSDPMHDLQIIDRWLGERLAAEPRRAGALRVVYIERETGPLSRDVASLVAQKLAAADPALLPELEHRYRVERSGVPHAYIAAICLPQLLANPAAVFDWSRI
jgi:hypothetical protein